MLRVPGIFDPAGVAPLLCAGITTYRRCATGRRPGKKVGIVGLGGLAHGVKFAHAGAHTVLFTIARQDRGRAAPGADEVVISKDGADDEARPASISHLDCVRPHDLNAYPNLLNVDGTMTLVGAPPQPASVSAFNLISVAAARGLAIGGIRETQEMPTAASTTSRGRQAHPHPAGQRAYTC